MKKILVVVAAPLTNDGLTRIALDIFFYNREKYDFAFATPAGTDEHIVDRLRDAGAGFMVLPKKRQVFAYMRTLRRLIRESGYDLVYVHGNSAFMIVETLPAKMAGAKVITHCHNTSSAHPGLHHVLKPLFNATADVKIGCSELASAWAYNKKRVITVPNGVDEDAYRYDETVRAGKRRELGMEQTLIVGFIGRLARQKNPICLIDIFREILKIEADAKLLLIGEGDLSQAVDERIGQYGIRDSVKKLPFQNDIVPYLQAMDVIVMPSLYEGLPLVPIEAQANGLPVVLSDACTGEVFASDYVKRFELSRPADEWAQAAVTISRELERGASKEKELTRAGLTRQSMNRRIADIIKQAL